MHDRNSEVLSPMAQHGRAKFRTRIAPDLPDVGEHGAPQWRDASTNSSTADHSRAWRLTLGIAVASVLVLTAAFGHVVSGLTQSSTRARSPVIVTPAFAPTPNAAPLRDRSRRAHAFAVPAAEVSVSPGVMSPRSVSPGADPEFRNVESTKVQKKTARNAR
ncbi:MAG: hypothetical protein ABIR62_07835 [Dokdonella sp.]|uniref:hypothetical protein n=1 Tax=Dokdonella sp. TaxID=2291710 RepID=UPI00326443FF